MDSTHDAFFFPVIFNAFDEPNISLRPSEEITLRLFFNEMGSFGNFISITPTEITIKQGDRPLFDVGVQNLSEKEIEYLSILEMGFPIEKRLLLETKPGRKRFLDSIIKAAPELKGKAIMTH